MLCVRSCFEFIERLFYGAVWANLSPFLFRAYRGLFLPFCSIINPHIACYARLMMKQNHQKHPPDSLRNKFQTASESLAGGIRDASQVCRVHVGFACVCPAFVFRLPFSPGRQTIFFLFFAGAFGHTPRLKAGEGVSSEKFLQPNAFERISSEKFLQPNAFERISSEKFLQKRVVGENYSRKFLQKKSVGENYSRKRLQWRSVGRIAYYNYRIIL